MRPVTLFVLSLAVLTQGFARLEKSICGTHGDRQQEEMHLHRHVTAVRKTLALGAGAADASRDIGEIAIIEDSDGVVARRNEFNLDGKTVQFSPLGAGAARYRFQTSGTGYDSAAATAGAPLRLDDDDTSRVSLPFAFPFYGNTYQQIFVNSDGNLTFLEGDVATSDRSLGRMTAGPARIAGLFMDLNPPRKLDGIRVLAESGRFVVSWVGVPDYQDQIVFEKPQTFQIRMYPDGRIELAYNGISTGGTDGAVVGISPGGLLGTTSIVSFALDTSGEYTSTIAERFGGREEIDLVTAAQKFYQTHDDAYDYLAIYNNLGIGACTGSVACETTVRNSRTGYGDPPIEVGSQFGSASRLQAVLNMGPLDQYPKDPTGIIPGRSEIRDTPVTVIAHETGHLFLAFASVRDPNNSAARPMLRPDNRAHWAFSFNSEASLLEGNRIRDNGPAVSPRFTTTGTVEGYSPLDQYLMGFRMPEEVPSTFLVTGPSPDYGVLKVGQTGLSFNGQRRDVTVSEIIAAEGRRIPDSTVSQRRFRFAFIMIVRQGSTPSQADLDQLDAYRRQFESYYAKAASDRASADTALRMSLRLSIFPAVGVLAGRSLTASVSIQKPATVALPITLRMLTGAASSDPSVTIPAGATSANFTLTGVRASVDEITAQPADPRYDSASSRIQVLSRPDSATLKDVSCPPGVQCIRVIGPPAASQSVSLRVSDLNELPYPGVRVLASAGSGGSVTPSVAVSDAAGRVTFVWNPGVGPGRVLAVRIEDAASAPLYIAGGLGFTAPVNAASGAQGLSAGGIASIFGVGLSSSSGVSAPFPWPDALGGVQVLLDGKPVPVMYVSATQINFLVPSTQSVGTANVTVVSGSLSVEVPVPAPVTLVSPGVFFDAATGYGAILIPGTSQTTKEQPAARGSFVEIYATGLGPTGAGALRPDVTIGGLPARVDYYGLAPGYLGLYQVNVQIPTELASGEQPLYLIVGGVRSNTVKIGIR